MEQLLQTLFTNKPTNPLITASLYSFQLLTHREQQIWMLATALMDDLDPSCRPILHDTLTAVYCLYTATNVIYQMPSMLNKPICNGKPSLHLVFGENVAQLVSVSLVAEAFQLISQLQGKSTTNQQYIGRLMKHLHQEHEELQVNSAVFQNLENIQKSHILSDYTNLQTKLLASAISSVLIICGHSQPTITRAVEVLTEWYNAYLDGDTIAPTKLSLICEVVNVSTQGSKFYQQLHHSFGHDKKKSI